MFLICDNVCTNWQKIGGHLERVSNIKPFINKRNWEGIKYLSDKNEKSYTTNFLP